MKRANDTVFRIGGEEFAVIYQANSVKKAWEVVENIRKATESLHKYYDIADKITISAGLLTIGINQSTDAKRFYEIADELLYQAKNKGRNQVIMREYIEDSILLK